MANERNQYMAIAQLTPGMKNVNVNFIVIEMGHSRRTPQGLDVRTIRVADHSGSVNMGIWNEVGEFLQCGDICRLRNGYTTVYKGCLSLSCGKLGELQKTGEFFLAFSDVPNMSEFNAEYASKYPMGRKGSPEEDNVPNGGPGPQQGLGSSMSKPSPLAPLQRPSKRPSPGTMNTVISQSIRRDGPPMKISR
ncbi:hypothetical protein AB6A40_004062 [Gnathostoma spinigerum]|uniref:Uncharacterized protein n=1 Tax=Gnathostoma spinigerum TaxID=75299 RepID=A0ABD6EK60_9BILA